MKTRQLRAILWLRFRLTRNAWARSRGLSAVVSVLVALGGAALALSGFTFGMLGGALALHGADPAAVMWTWLVLSVAFLFSWMLAVVIDLQRSEVIDIPRLLHLPIALGAAYAINYVASLLGATLALFVPAMLGLSLGLVADRGPIMLLLVPLSMGLVFMVTAWTYMVQGWIATWVQSPRRRRVVLTAVGLSVALLAQTPNLVINVLLKPTPEEEAVAATELGPASPGARAERARRLEAASRAREKKWASFAGKVALAEEIVPPLWLAGGARALAEGDPRVALLGALGFAMLGALGIQRGYRSTLRFYTSGARSAVAARASGSASTAGKRLLVERRFPGVHEQTSAVAFASLRSMLRAPEVTMGVGFSLLMLPMLVVVLGTSFGRGVGRGSPFGPLIAAGLIALLGLTLSQLMNNQFGYDREGLRALLLAPVAGRRLLLGKNLALLMIGAPACAVVLAASALWLWLPPLAVVAAALQAAALLLIAVTAGNLLSILVPYRVLAGSMRATKLPPGAMLAVFISLFGAPILFSPLFVGPLAVIFGQSTHPMLVDLAASLVVAAVAAGVYAATLAPLGRLLQRRQTVILARVTRDQE